MENLSIPKVGANKEPKSDHFEALPYRISYHRIQEMKLKYFVYGVELVVLNCFLDVNYVLGAIYKLI